MNVNISNPGELVRKVREGIASVFVGKPDEVQTLLLGFFSGLHVLIEDIPGVGKTTLARALAKTAGLDFGRVQFTPDILPGDILGMTVWSQEKREFIFKSGAIMHQFILADEINRASPRTQAALLEAMQEGKVTVDGSTFTLPEPFFVLATQNPVSFTGTFSLPEAETDRFDISLSLGYPTHADEVNILERFRAEDPEDRLEAVATPEQVLEVRDAVRAVHAKDRVKDYLVNIAKATRSSSLIKLGMSPRATQHLLLASQAQALFSGRDFIVPEDVRGVAPAVLGHRIILSAEAKMENRSPRHVIEHVLQQVSPPSGIS